MEVKAEYKVVFAEEAHEKLQEWEAALLELERRPGDRELVNQMFRAIHTLKGSAGFIGFEKFQRVVHDLESALQNVRDGTVALGSTTLELLFRGLDLSRRMVESFTAGTAFEEDVEGFLKEVGASGGGAAAATAQPAPAASAPKSAEAAPTTPAVGTAAPARAAPSGGRRFQLALHVQASGREAYLRAFLVRSRLAGVATIMSEDPPPEVLKDSMGKFAYTLTLATSRDEAALRDALNIDLLSVDSVRELTQEPATRAAEAKPRPTAAEFRPDEVVRVSVERLDLLLNLVGELVIQNSGFKVIADQLRERYGKGAQVQELEEKTAGLAKITRDLQDGIMKVRMLPVNNVFSRFHRVVRDLARDSGKDITLEVYGEETEIDKKVMDRIGDPLVHLIRNAVDHGIEQRERRLVSGKPPAGLIRLGAYQDGDHICIEVSDDGDGLDREAVLAKAVEKGLVRAAEAPRLSDEQILGLIFLPGFSTARKVTEVSGRGVGLDVVKRAVEALDGSLRVRSTRGRGTTVTISLPLTMAIISALLVEVGDSILAIPLSSVKEVLKVAEEERSTVGRQETIRLRNNVLALVQLREALGLDASSGARDGSRQPVAIVDFEDKRIGLCVDRVLGNREIVIKSLSRHYREIEGLIGASILGDGRIALIVDVQALVRKHYQVARESAGDLSADHVDAQVDRIRGTDPDAAPADVSAAAPADAPAAAPAAEPQPPVDSSPAAPPAESSRQPPAADFGGITEEMRAVTGGAMEEIHNEGAIQSSIALSQMCGQEVRVSFPESQVVALGGIAGELGGEEAAVGGIYVGLVGDVSGSILLILPEENLMRFHELLHHQPAGSCTKIADLDLSCLSELGNVLSACFINALANGTHLRIRSEAPEISVDMCQAVVDTVLSRFNRPGDRLLLTKALLYLGVSQQVVCHLLLFLEPDSLHRLIGQLRGAKPDAKS
jgi:two-component system chemotaxis sensor kinase CheA